MTAEQVEMEIAKVNPGAVTCASKAGDSVAVLKDGRWVTVAAKMLGGKWAAVTMLNLCANGKEVWPQDIYMKVGRDI